MRLTTHTTFNVSGDVSGDARPGAASLAAPMPPILAGLRAALAPFGRLERPKRVLYLLSAVILMSIADLAITLVWVTEIGLAESNPLARWVIAQGSAELLAVWKMITILPAVLVFACLRDKPVAEFGSIVAALVLAAVTVHWYAYHADADELVLALPAFEQGVDERWIMMASTDPLSGEGFSPGTETLAASATLRP